MGDGPTGTGLAILVDEGGSVARVTFRADTDPAEIDPDHVAAAARERHVEVDEGVLARIVEAVRRYREVPGDREHVIAERVPAVAGVDGRIDWVDGFDPTAPRAADDATGRVDHYNCVRYVLVSESAHVATVYAPTLGCPGRDVRGRAIVARPGRPCPIRIGPGLHVEDDGRLIADRDGMLHLVRDLLCVSRLLKVPGWVDFSTGNITFDGSVTIGEGVRDRFEVRTTESIVVEGAVEAARIECGGSFTCLRGMSGKDHGHLNVGGDAEVGYLNLVRGVVGGDLIVHREVRNCRLNVAGRLLGVDAAVVGGDSVVRRGVRVRRLGSARETTTTLVIGAEAQGHRLERLRTRLEQQRDDCRRQLTQVGGRPSSRRKDYTAALEKNMAEIAQRIGWARKELEDLAPVLEYGDVDRDLDVEVFDAVHVGVRLLIADLEITPLRTLAGGLVLRLGDDLPKVSYGGTPQPLTSLMRVHSRAA